jgi:hypothetical protein
MTFVPWKSLLAVLLAISLCTAGCSFAFVKGPPPRTEAAPQTPDQPGCTQQNWFPWADFAAAVYSGSIVVISGIGTPPRDETVDQMQARERETAIYFWGALAVGALAMASGLWGLHATHECRWYVRVHAPLPALTLKQGI